MDVGTLQSARRRNDVGAVRCVRHRPVQRIRMSAVLSVMADRLPVRFLKHAEMSWFVRGPHVRPRSTALSTSSCLLQTLR